MCTRGQVTGATRGKGWAGRGSFSARCRYPGPVTTQRRTAPCLAPRLVTRRVTSLAVALLATWWSVAAVALAGPAHADVPVGWSPDPESVNPVHAVLVLVVLPIALAAVIGALVYLPSMARGESVSPAGSPPGPNQWIGGPSRATAELAGPDGDDSTSGGARGTW